MISRRILPCRTAISLAAMTSRCQFIASSVCGLRSWKQRAANRAKSLRSKASYSARVRSSIIGYSFLAMQPGHELRDDLLVRRAERARRGFRFRPAFEILLDVEHKFGGAPTAFGRLVDELLDNGLAFADLSPPAVLSNDDALVQRLAEQGREVLVAGRPAF